ncbi:MAG: ATP-dependent DNA helicase, partial [Clostridium sp.]
MDTIVNIRDSVRGVIEFVLRVGHLDDRYMGKNRAVEGTLAHQKLQANNEIIYNNYEKEVKLEKEFYIDNIVLKIEGRADGIIIENNTVYIEEIKSTYKSLLFIEEDYNEMHWSQAKFYAYIYGEKNALSNISVRLSYYNIETDEVKSFDKSYDLIELQNFVYNIIEEYSKWIKLKGRLNKERNISVSNLEFPFDVYRKGQRELAVNSYRTIRQKGILFAQAPTGIGKTISTIYPAIKALGEGLGSRIMYLTAKTITRTVAEEAFIKLKSKGLNFRNITLTSKEKICFQDKVKCNPDDCIYAVNYFGKANEVVFSIISNEKNISRGIIEKYARKYELCPFELSLDLSVWCDAIICDYNYAFDPRVRLKRIFEDNLGENILLIDEGHNLVSRAREMFSAEIYKSKFLLVAKLVKGTVPNLYKALNEINKALDNIRSEVQVFQGDSSYYKEEYKDLYRLLKVALKEGDEYLVKAKGTNAYEEVLDVYFDIRSFLSIADLYSDEYVTLVDVNKSEVKVKLFCVNPSKNLQGIV